MSIQTKDSSIIELVEKSKFLEAMSHLPGAVSIVTAGDKNNRVGLTVSALCSLSADTPSLIACVNKSASSHDKIIRHGAFAVNILHPSQSALATQFTKKDIDRFANYEWVQQVTGAPVLSTAVLSFDCWLEEAIDGYSHSILIGKVAEVNISNSEDAGCLVWHRRKYRTCSDIIESIK
jgi:Conserved protein/domain typically associated with flavoprotein oxygenases, DIM6/NTAB family